MNMVSIAKGHVDLQKDTATNLFNTLSLLQDFSFKLNRLWMDQVDADGKVKTTMEEWQAVFRKGNEDSKVLVDSFFSSIDDYLSRLAA